MRTGVRSESPTILLRISDGTFHMHRAFSDFAQAQRSAEAFAGSLKPPRFDSDRGGKSRWISRPRRGPDLPVSGPLAR